MKRKLLMRLSFFVTVNILAGCSSDSLDNCVSQSRNVKKVTGMLAETSWVDVNMDNSALTKTSIVWDSSLGAISQRVRWNLGDRVFSFSERGVYMSDVIESSKILDVGAYKSVFEIAYHEGDLWYVAYLKGAAIEDNTGRRTLNSIFLPNGIPNIQNGSFKDHHICAGVGVPETDTLHLSNMQAFMRFRVEGDEEMVGGRGSGKVAGQYIKKIEIHNVTSEYMAGDLNINVDGGRYTLSSRSDADSMITVTPLGAVHFSPDSVYYVAIPVRSYKLGIRFDLYNNLGRVGFVKTPNLSVSYNTVYNVDDMLKYLVFLAQRVVLRYEGYSKSSTDTEHIVADTGDSSASPVIDPVSGISLDLVEGHYIVVTSQVLPSATTNKSLEWVSSDTGIATVSASGVVYGVSGGTMASPKIAVIKAKTRDGSGLEVSFTVKVTEPTGLSLGDYTPGSDVNFD